MVVFPNCKINLGLHILQKRNDGFHDLETVFYPIALQDGLEIIQNASPRNDIELTTSGLEIDTTPSENICTKTYQLLKKDFPHLPAVKIHLHKVIPSGAGLGGGSADGAFTLLLLNKKFNLELNDQQLIQYALQLGSDCPFFIINKPCYATGRGEQIQEIPIDLSEYKFILVNPKIHINTGWAFSQINLSSKKASIRKIIELPIPQWKENLTNNFEEPIFKHQPSIRQIKEYLYEHGAVYASMSGSGSTVFGIFKKEDEPKVDFPSHYFVKSI